MARMRSIDSTLQHLSLLGGRDEGLAAGEWGGGGVAGSEEAGEGGGVTDPMEDTPLSSCEDTECESDLESRQRCLQRPDTGNAPGAGLGAGLSSGVSLPTSSSSLICLRLHRDIPVSRKPFANGLLSIFILVIRSFCTVTRKMRD